MVRRSDRSRWASCDAAGAGSATGGLRRIRLELKSSQDFRQKEPRAQPGIQQHCAFAVPADTRFRGIIALQNWSGVDIAFLNSTARLKNISI